ncbi:uncharacterized protein TA16355 [Theileria annulata]|uniref:Uncharacterized protein n=1 Tax=Theileria annulata TaxID=5874 RepID=Q4UIU9_THEAN|nr:uncharacterized protein TA16355 [Theileria annulata]CAI72990.1 hypothetical protein, conserved [Theileria annulata]|eukprot:XP_953668.1 hypothetical protein, conserved [Theileria annulata]
MAYYVAHDRVFINNNKRSTGLNPIKTTNSLGLNKNFFQQNFRPTSLHAIKHDSNYLLGSSIVNLNFVNNVSNPNRGFEGCRNIPITKKSFCQGVNLNDSKYPSAINHYPLLPNVSNHEHMYPFENYTYYKPLPEYCPHTPKNNLNFGDRIISMGTTDSIEFKQCDDSNDSQDPIITRNYLSNLQNDQNNEVNEEIPDDSPLRENNHDFKCVSDSRINERKSKLDEYLEKSKTLKDKTDNSHKTVKITSGKPTYEFVAKYPDPVEKELERWHNSHNSTLKWERIRHGLYSVGGSIVRLVKVNGSLFVEGHGFKKYKGQLGIQKFVEEKESRLLRE